MISLEEQERLICEQLEDLRKYYMKACEPLVKHLIHIRSLRPPPPLILSESEYKAWKELKK